MNKKEFLQALRGELINSVSGQIIEEQLRFYSEYIDTEVGKGRGEEEVVAELSAPNLLARSIIEAADAGGDRVARTTPFRYEEKDINYASDEEDLRYQGTASEKDRFDSETESLRYERRESSSNGSGNYSRNTAYGDSGNGGYGNSSYGNNRESHGYRPYIPVSSTGCLLFTIVVIALLVLVVLVFVGILSFLAPILFPVLCIAVILWLLSGILNR
ncbi:DUF1700 domain-containing protein [Oribacterium sp. oral taxon 108]|uniref:DUF1700 domain-containing protein n=1 Tax=Oribacterium sp. oral taxon 108 TaxID=712414 RepID=UPI00020DD49E|nr:hypothetical protein [Oribacterium sp. oral taxon 108]EGL36590.1 hypothetical protein HMPREF9124_1129 [Oribacterium sp. oral taxon 108 str. F0425]